MRMSTGSSCVRSSLPSPCTPMILRLPSPEFYLYQYKTNRGGGCQIFTAAPTLTYYTPPRPKTQSITHTVSSGLNTPETTSLRGKTRTPYRCRIRLYTTTASHRRHPIRSSRQARRDMQQWFATRIPPGLRRSTHLRRTADHSQDSVSLRGPSDHPSEVPTALLAASERLASYRHRYCRKDIHNRRCNTHYQ